MPRFEIGLPDGYTLTADGLRINVLKQGCELQPFRQGERDRLFDDVHGCSALPQNALKALAAGSSPV